MSKSPKGDSLTEAIFIYKGELLQLKSMNSVPPKFNSGYRLHSHVDVSDGDSSNVLNIEDNHIRLYYTSPNEKAWKEKAKIGGSILCLPNWNLQVLMDFYLSLGCNEVFITAKRKIEVREFFMGHYEDDETHQRYSLQFTTELRNENRESH
jgi:hypothetical protein